MTYIFEVHIIIIMWRCTFKELHSKSFMQDLANKRTSIVIFRICFRLISLYLNGELMVRP